MSKRIRTILLCATALMVLSGCIGGNDQQDLDEFIADTKRRPKLPLDPLPSFDPYEPFTYGANRLRNPFEQPVAEVQNMYASGNKDVRPDFDRPKEPFENFDISFMSMVGFIEMEGEMKALINNGEGLVYPLVQGNYIGKNHGRIVAIREDKVEVVEIVADGLDGWIERPRTLQLSEKE